MFIAALTIFVLAYIQNVSFSIVSRSRNRSSVKYHIVASIFSNGVWFLTFRELVTADMSLALFVPYTAATVLGSVTGVKVSMWIENLIGATSDDHIKSKKDERLDQLEQRILDLELAMPYKPVVIDAGQDLVQPLDS